MKKHLFAIMACALLAVSCVTETREPERMTGTVLSLTAATEQPASTRTVVAGEGGVFWEEGDAIKVFAGTASGRFVSDVESGIAETTVFTGSLGGAWAEGSPLWAVYPYAEDASLDGETLTAVIPAVQTARGMSFAQGMNLSVARTTTPSLTFYNVGGGLCFTLSGDGVGKVVFEGLNGEMLAGKVKIGWQEDRPVVQEVMEGSTAISLSAPEGQTLEAGLWYYIVALPGALDKGFNLSFYKGNMVARKTFSKAVTVKRSIYGEIRNADEGATYFPDTGANISFKDAKVKEIVVRYFDSGKDGELSYREAAAVRSFLVDEALTRSDGGMVSVFAGTGITTFPEIVYFTGLTKFEDGVFAGCTSLTSITIPSNITEIGANAFKGCTGLQSITVESETPPTIGEGAFSDTNDCPIIVPAGTTASYVSAWSSYASRIEGAQPDNEIWYTSTDGQAVQPYDRKVFGANIVSNVYQDGKGVLKFDEPLTAIGDYAFYQRSSLQTVSLPRSVTKLGTGVFSMCSGLTEFFLPAWVTELGGAVIAQCYSLKSISVSPDNPSYDSRNNCNALIETATNSLLRGCINTVIPESITTIQSSAFSQIADLKAIVIPRAVTAICMYAFNGTGLTHVTIPENVTRIDRYAFYRCPDLKLIEVLPIVPPSTVSGISTMFDMDNDCPIFVPAESLETYKTIWRVYADRIRAIESAAQPDNEIWYTSTDGQAVQPLVRDVFGANIVSNEYQDGKGVLKFDGPVTQIGDNAFRNCGSLESMMIPSGVTSIGFAAFVSCSSLVKLTIPDSFTSLGDSAFEGCSRLIGLGIPAGVTKIDDYTFYGCSSLTSVEMSNVTSIGYRAFAKCSSLKDLEIPSSVSTIRQQAFERCSTLVRIVIPDAVTVIEPYTFNECVNLSSIRLSSNVTQIGEAAFADCSSLTGLEIPAGLTRIEDYTFYGCSSLASLEIPSSVTSIGQYAFYECASLPSIILPANVTSIGEGTFWGCSGLTRLVIPSGITSIEPYTFCDCVRLTSIDLPSNVTSMGEGAFFDCSSLTGLNIPAGVTKIEKITFMNCTRLTSLELPSHVTSIGARAFMSCSSLARMTIPDGVTSIEWDTFYGCSNLTTVEMPNVTSIGENAFFQCTSLTTVVLPVVTSIDKFAFYRCTSLSNLTLPASVTNIGDRAFLYCPSLSAISVWPATPPLMGIQVFDGSDCPIGVPTASVDAYKAADGWSTYATRIVAIAD